MRRLEEPLAGQVRRDLATETRKTMEITELRHLSLTDAKVPIGQVLFEHIEPLHHAIATVTGADKTRCRDRGDQGPPLREQSRHGSAHIRSARAIRRSDHE